MTLVAAQNRANEKTFDYKKPDKSGFVYISEVIYHLAENECYIKLSN